jgi:Probable Zinc-ribbon domain
MKKWKPPEIEDVDLPFCGRQRKNTTTLLDKHPEIAEEWCYAKNCGWGPEQFSHASSVKAWWVCPDCNREYKSQVYNRTAGLSACPYCASKKVCEDNALTVFYAAVCREWHPTKNGKMKPEDVTKHSSRKIWWKCATCNHAWKAPISARTSLGSCCPACYEKRMEETRLHPKVRIRPVIELNDKNKKIPRSWYDSGHRPYTPLSKTHPAVAKEWHPTANGKWTPNDFAPGSEVVAWWKCDKGPDHEWQTPIFSRTGNRAHKCPFCVGMRVSVDNSLQTLFPEIARQWHAKLNAPLKQTEVTAHSKKKVWWVCSANRKHIWDATVNNRTAGRGCPFCQGKRIGQDNNLKAKFPKISAQWHPTKNGDLKPEDIAPASGQRIWWRCPEGPDHIWQATCGNRTGRNSGCPACNGKQISVTNSLASLFPKIAKQWHPTKNGDLRANQVTSRSTKLAWWQCEKKHTWQQSVDKRTKRVRGCKLCAISSK